MMKSYYHATPYQNLDSILSNGIKKGYDGYVYLTESPESAATFVRIRGHRDILSFEVQLEESMIEESFDHSQAFFKCRAFIYPGDIPADRILSIKRYEV